MIICILVAMNVELPWFLFFLFLIVIPIIIHLLNFQRPKRLLFTRLDFIEKIEHKSKSVRSIKKWLILLSRIGLVISLVLAFSVPFLLENEKEKVNEEAYFLLDANHRMGQQLEEVSVLEHAKSFFHKYLKENPLMTYKFSTSSESVRYESSAEYVNEKIEEVKLSRTSLTDPDNNIRQLELGKENRETPVFFVSDFHKQVSLGGIDTNQRITLVRMRKQMKRNVSIDSVYISYEQGVKYIAVEITSSGGMTSDAQIQLKIDNVLQGSKRCEIQKEG